LLLNNTFGKIISGLNVRVEIKGKDSGKNYRKINKTLLSAGILKTN